MSQDSIHHGKHLSKYLMHVPWYLLSSICTKLIGFMLLPVYTSYFAKEEIGSLSTYESLGRIIIVAISLYLDAAFIRFYYKIKAEKPHEIGLFFSTHFYFVLLWGSFASIVLVFAIPVLTPGLPVSTKYLLPALILTQLMSQLTSMLTSIWSANLEAKKIAIYQIIFSLFSLLFTLYLIFVNKSGWESRIYALNFVYILQLTLVVWIAIKNKWLILKYNLEYIIISLKYSIPLMPNVAAGWIAMFSDRLILSYYGHLDQAGVYSLAAQLAMILYVLNDSITRIQSPLAMSGLTDNPTVAKRDIARFLIVYFSIISFCYCCILYILPDAVKLMFGDEYLNVIDVFFILGWVYILSGLYRVFANIISFHGATWIISSGALFQAIINVSFNLLFIPMYGMYAAALSTVLSMTFYTLWIFMWSQKLDKIKIKYFNLLSVLACTFSVLIILTLLKNTNINNTAQLLIKILLFIIMIIWTYSSQSLATKNYIKYKLPFLRF